MSRVVFIRPGMTESGQMGRKLGLSDEPLLEEERRRLRQRSEKGEYPSVGRVYVGPSARCRETASLVYPRMPAVVINELAAFDCGEFEGKTQEELNRDHGFQEWAASPALPDCPGGGNLNWYVAQCMKSIRIIAREMENYRIDTVAIVAHGLAIELIAQRVCLPRTQYKKWGIGWGGGLVMAFYPVQLAAVITEIL